MLKHVTVYREPGRFAGWPANYGIWAWGNEIVVGFTVGYFQTALQGHARDKERPFTTLQARSLDGGEHWLVGPMPCQTPGNRALSADEHQAPGLKAAEVLERDPTILRPCPGGINFTHPDFALLCARTALGAGTRAWFYVSNNRCQQWEGPYALPSFGQTGIAARTDYLISDRDTCTLFLTAAKPNGQEGRVFCARTTDGGKSFQFRAWVTPEPPEGYFIMPASVRLSSTRILTAVRCFAGKSAPIPRAWIDLYASDDDGLSWRWLAQPVENSGALGGNPPTLTHLLDGRLCLTYGYREPPFGLRAVFSMDEGCTWSAPRVLRADGGNSDLGYPRTVQRPDGTLVTVYYYNDDPNSERYIAATLWTP